MDSSYKGYYLEETSGKIFVFRNVEDWRNHEAVEYADTEEQAHAWIDNDLLFGNISSKSTPEAITAKIQALDELLDKKGVKWESTAIRKFNRGDRVRVIGPYMYGSIGTVGSFEPGGPGMAVRMDGQGEHDDQDVFTPEELEKI